ncbi:hypothetical protein NDU88_007557 [Pleurodeles waltl]|uniref:Uncharacterized protein n=1 Tax=Pleurodeles waltl TaxID=8319 RepID=A0AAV7WJ03_PLEWA|nr:hypothetical protein NDU88_007557 [Pleurodeles waltl]
MRTALMRCPRVGRKAQRESSREYLSVLSSHEYNAVRALEAAVTACACFMGLQRRERAHSGGPATYQKKLSGRSLP